MKLTQNDVNEVMKAFSGKVSEQDKASTRELTRMFRRGHEANSLWPAIATDALVKILTEGKGIAEAIQEAAQAGVFVGLTIGFHLGLREAGLEMGIPTSSNSKASENNLEEED